MNQCFPSLPNKRLSYCRLTDRRNDSEVEWQRCHFCVFSQPPILSPIGQLLPKEGACITVIPSCCLILAMHYSELAASGGQSSRDYSSLSHHRTYRSVYGGSIPWADYILIALF